MLDLEVIQFNFQFHKEAMLQFFQNVVLDQSCTTNLLDLTGRNIHLPIIFKATILSTGNRNAHKQYPGRHSTHPQFGGGIRTNS